MTTFFGNEYNILWARLKLKQYSCKYWQLPTWQSVTLLIIKVNKFVVTSSGELRCFYKSFRNNNICRVDSGLCTLIENKIIRKFIYHIPYIMIVMVSYYLFYYSIKPNKLMNFFLFGEKLTKQWSEMY